MMKTKRMLIMSLFDWEQRKLGEALLVNSGKDYKSLNRGNVPVYGTGGYMLSVDRALSNEDAIGIGRKGTIDRPQYLTAPFWTVDTLFFLTMKNQNDLKFFYALFQKINWKKYDESTGLPSLSKSTLNNIFLKNPNYKEQKKIGLLLSQIDVLITLQQRKLNLLKLLKKAMLQVLFTDKNIPLLHFANFSETWDLVRLKDIGKATGGTSIESEFISRGGTHKVINIGSYKENHTYHDQGIRVNLNNKTQKRVLNKGDLTMILNDKTSAGRIIGSVLLIPADNAFVYNQRTERIEPNHKNFSSRFLYQYLNSPNIRNKIISNAQGNTQIYVNWSSISKIQYLMPKRKEQDKIGNLLFNLDTFINDQKLKIIKYNNLKNFLLQNMFI